MKKQKNKFKDWGALFFAVIFELLFIFVTSSKFLRVIFLTGLCISLWHNHKQEKTTINKIWFWATGFFSLVYLSVAVGEYWIGAVALISAAILTILGIVIGILFLSGFIIGYFTTILTTGKKIMKKIVIPYIILSMTIVLIFGGLGYFPDIHSGENVQKTIKEVTDSLQLSLSAYYSVSLIDTPTSGWARGTFIIETIVSYIVHIIVLGIAVSKQK